MRKILFLLALCFLVYAQEGRKRKGNVIVKYKKHQTFDLGALQIEGKVLAPGDLTINDQGTRNTDYPLFNRRHFRDEMIQDIYDAR